LSDTIDERTAWSLLRAVPLGIAGRAVPTQVHHDPNPDVWLQVDASGQWTTSGEVSDAARDLVDLYLPLQLSPDLVIGQIGQSLDGRIATADGHSHYVTGPADIRRLHRLRALVDAVVVGAGTVAADNPRLTVRDVEGENPVRVVLDPRGRLSPDRAVFRDGAARTLVVRLATGPQYESSSDGDLLELPAGVPRQDDGDGGGGGFAPATVIEALRARGLRRILVEGGGVTVSRFLQAGALTRLHVTVAPLLIGSGRHALTLPPIATLDQALRPPCHLFHLGNDVLFDLDLR
jgi:diaminohydroxyphosphoribosylaminopyrimidine deaminase/5-amino-6-(5-phosphoribosylamino)uracil reductase